MKREIEFNDESKPLVYKNPRQAARNHQFIGFVPGGPVFYGSGRYMIITSGHLFGIAARPQGTWALDPFPEGTYYAFDSARELYEWLLGETI